jgi:hypothetical protein
VSIGVGVFWRRGDVGGSIALALSPARQLPVPGQLQGNNLNLTCETTQSNPTSEPRDSHRNHVPHHTSPPGYAAYPRHVHATEPEAVYAPDGAHDGTCAGKLSARVALERC